MVPVTEAAASVHMLLQRAQFRLFSSKKASTTLKISFSGGSPLHAFAEQYVLSYVISIAVSHKTNQLCTYITSVDLSNCNANEPVSFATP